MIRTRRAALAAIPDRSDRGSRPARAEGAAIVLPAVKAGPAEIVPLAVIAEIAGHGIDIPGQPVAAHPMPQPVFLRIERLGVARRLMIARQETVAMPAWR